MTSTLLPTLPSELIRVALKDLKTCEDSMLYKINMDKWHKPGWGYACSVCFAGAVMAQSLGAKRRKECSPSDFAHSDDADALYALNMFRVGYVTTGLANLDLYSILPDRQVVEYADDPALFVEQMYDLADDLQVEGL